MSLLDDPRVAFRVRKYRKRAAAALDTLATKLTPPPSPADLRRKVGGAWEEIGKLQFDYLVEQGLRPEHNFLDLGCGVLRGGLHFVRYLEPGHYYGIDANPAMITGSKAELEAALLVDRRPNLRVTETFEIDFGVAFDYGLALSVFTHLPLNSIARALANVSERFAVGGTFFATYFPGPRGPERFSPITHPSHDGHPKVTTFADANPYHYHYDDFVTVCEPLPLQVDNIGDWDHPRAQHMLRFTRTTA